MNELLPFIVVGVTSGCVYGMAAVGLVVTYKTSGVFNFAQGALGTAAAYLFFALHVQHRVPWPVAALVCVPVLSVPLGLGLEGMARRLSSATLTMQVVATVGILVGVEAVCNQLYGTTSQVFPQYLPTSTFSVAGTNVQWNQLIIVGVSIAATGGLYVFFRTARLGKAMRAVVDNPQLLDLSGTSPNTVRRFAWIIGSFLATLAGLLLAPSISLDSSALTLLVVQALGAVAIGRFSSLPMTWAGGLVLGVASSVAAKYATSGNWFLGGLPLGLPFLILFVVLLAYPKRWLPTRTAPIIRDRIAWRAAPRVRLAGGLAAAIFLVAVPSIVSYQLTTWTVALTDVLLFLSLGLLVRTAGQVSLCQLGFAAVGAAAFSNFAASAHLPWAAALLLSGLIVVPVGALIAIPAIRLSGLYLAIATFGFGILLQQMFYQSSFMFGLGSFGLAMPRPDISWLSSDTGFYYLVLALTVLAAGLTVVITETRLGRLLRGLGESPRALTTSGANLNVTYVIVFSISAFLAGIAGALQGASLSVVTDTNFDPFLSLTFVAIIVISLGGEPWYALVAGGAFALIPGYWPSQGVANIMQIIFGVGAVLVGLGITLPTPPRLMSALKSRKAASRVPPEKDPARLPGAGRQASALQVEDLVVRFGGLVAVDHLSVLAEPGVITGLIGPNGAGKTTTFNACSGLVRPSAGRVLLGGTDISRFAPARRAQNGLGRTFQQVELCESLSVYDNVAIGCEGGIAGSNPLGHVLSRRATRRAIDSRVWDAVRLCGLDTVIDTPAHALSTGQRRLLELARCLTSPFDMLLLDEPSSGLDRTETERFGGILERIVAERGLGILLVEHDMALVMKVCSMLYVCDYGKLIFSGAPSEARMSPAVQAAYLGEPEPNEATSENAP
jgi:ABC-type branched-subunit amino acid transport system ATPase component/branched-subunit amino acid ABC-type transport system permease component